MPELIRIPRRSPWMSQYLVIRALLLREMTTRFGKYRMGFFWMLLEPVFSVIFIGLILGTILERTVPEIPYAFFLLNGFVFLKLFTGPMSSALNALSSNQNLLVYPAVRPLDPFLARFAFELLTSLFSFLVFCIVGAWLGVDFSLTQLHILLACFIITWVAGCGLGLIFGVGAAHFREVEKIVPILQRPLLFISAILIPFSTLPGAARAVLAYNPLVHTIEISRKSLFPYYFAEDVNLTYPSAFAVVVAAIGLTVFRNNRHFLSQR